MEQILCQPDVMDRELDVQVATRPLPAANIATSDWRAGLPVLTGCGVTLRELRLSDAPSLLLLLTTDEVTRFISPPPTTVQGFEGFIRWMHRERAAGRYLCRDDAYLDQALRPIPDEDWRQAKAVWGAAMS
jgi:hypothetical protein